jgi:hypothetical protein
MTSLEFTRVIGNGSSPCPLSWPPGIFRPATRNLEESMRWTFLLLVGLALTACADDPVTSPRLGAADAVASMHQPEETGVLTANGWYEEEEIYYLLLGLEEGVTQRGQNDLYVIGNDRLYQANVAEFIPGEAGYTPHWNVNVVHTAAGYTLDDILASDWVSDHYPEALFDDVEDILAAADAGLVTIDTPGMVVLCPIIPEEAAEAPGNTELSEDFPPFPQTF